MHGGKRLGAGRKRLATGEPMQPAPFRLPPDTVLAIRQAASEAGIAPGLYVAEAIAEYQGRPDDHRR